MGKKILGLSAKKQGGKTTAVNRIKEILPVYSPDTPLVLSLATPLKDIVRHCFIPHNSPLRNSSLDDDADKNVGLPCGKTVREVLQVVGTDWFRTLWPDCWINAFRHAMGFSRARNIIIPDVRFPNEVQAIQSMGGHVIRFLRAPFRDHDTHASETALDEMEQETLALAATEAADVSGYPGRYFDACIDNREMSIPEQNAAVVQLLKERHWLYGL